MKESTSIVIPLTWLTQDLLRFHLRLLIVVAT